MLWEGYCRFEAWAIAWTARTVSGRHWKTRAVLLILAFSLLRAFPNYNVLRKPGVAESWNATAVKAADLTADMARRYDPSSHEAKLSFRLTVPAIVRILHLGVAGQLLLFALCSALLLASVLALSEHITGSRVAAAYIALGIACAWPGMLGIHHLLGGFYDSVALLLLLCALAAPAMPLAAAALFLAAWTDERSLAAAALLVTFAVLRRDRLRALAFVAACGAYILSRGIFAEAFGIGTATAAIGLQQLLANFPLLPLGVWSGLSGLWLMVAAALTILAVQRRYGMLSAFAAGLGLVTAPALLVYDLTRSLSYALPAVLLALEVVTHAERPQTVVRLSLIAALVSVAVPTWFVQSGNASWMLPLPYQLFRLLVYPRFG